MVILRKFNHLLRCEQEVRVSALRPASGLLSILPVYLTVCNLTPSPCLMVCVCVQFLFNNFHLTAIYRVVTRTSEVGKIRLPVCRSQSANSTRQLFRSPTVCLSVCLSVWLFDCATLEGVTARTLRWVVATLKFIIGKLRWCVRRSRRARGLKCVARRILLISDSPCRIHATLHCLCG